MILQSFLHDEVAPPGYFEPDSLAVVIGLDKVSRKSAEQSALYCTYGVCVAASYF
jgi:hypothetical protein